MKEHVAICRDLIFVCVVGGCEEDIRERTFFLYTGKVRGLYP